MENVVTATLALVSVDGASAVHSIGEQADDDGTPRRTSKFTKQ